ncbi:hypothetical protein GOODEAATRI_005949 [Goodea atripinnis]|uniref:C3H1-type domain-containing protein n=1 Tax=Goodea atripinnis TaxID=208336 RepID=A0ABV0PVL7_9TELE
MNSGLPPSAAPLGGAGIPNVKVKFCRYYAKDKTCFYGDECQFLHEDPSMGSMSLHGGGGSPIPLPMAGGGGTPVGYSLGSTAAAAIPGGGGTGVLNSSTEISNSQWKLRFEIYYISPCGSLRKSFRAVFTCFIISSAPNPAASEFIPKGAPRMAAMTQSAVQTYPSPLFAHPGLGGSTAALAPDVPSEVDSYHSLFPLEPLPPPNRMQKTSNFSYITSCYKAVNSKDDLPYCLRRIHGFRLVNTKCMMLVDMWKKIQHSNTVTLREVFTTKAFGDHSLVFSYDFHAGAETMFSRHFNDPAADSYFTKRKATRTSTTAAARRPSSGVTDLGLHRPAQLGLADHPHGWSCLSGYGPQQDTHHWQNQQADLVSLGKVVLALACNSLAGIQRENLQKAMELVSINYSSDLKNLIL